MPYLKEQHSWVYGFLSRLADYCNLSQHAHTRTYTHTAGVIGTVYLLQSASGGSVNFLDSSAEEHGKFRIRRTYSESDCLQTLQLKYTHVLAAVVADSSFHAALRRSGCLPPNTQDGSCSLVAPFVLPDTDQLSNCNTGIFPMHRYLGKQSWPFFFIYIMVFPDILAVQLFIHETISWIPATVMVTGLCSGRSLWSVQRSASHWVTLNEGSLSQALFHYCSLSSLGGSAYIVLPTPPLLFTGSTLGMVQWRTFFNLLFLFGQVSRAGWLKALGMVTLFLIAEPYNQAPHGPLMLYSVSDCWGQRWFLKALRYSHVPGDFQSW